MKVFRQRIWLLMIILILCMATGLYSISALADQDNLLANADFMETDAEGLPAGWFTDSYIQDPGYSVFSLHQEDNAVPYLEIKNIGLNDARLAQVIDVDPETLYCFSAEILADGIEEGHGANLSIEGLYSFSEELHETNGQWVPVEWYGETGPDQYSVTLFARLGGYSGLSKGRACFRNMKLVQTNVVPGDAIAARWFKSETVYVDDEDDYAEDTSSAWPWLVFIGLFYTLAGFWMIRQCRDGNIFTLQKHNNRERLALAAMLLLSLAVRCVVSWQIEGYIVDVNCFTSWGHTMATVGPVGFYQETNFCDYPPLYTYILGLNSWTASVTGANDGLTRLIFRLIPNLCDLASCWILYEIIRRRNTIPSAWAACVAAFLSFNPALIVNSAAWGQMDSVLCLLLMITAWCVMEKKWSVALPVYVVSVLIKPQALMLGPLGLCCFIMELVRFPESRKKLLISAGVSLVLLLVLILPFSINQSPGWLIRQYSGTLASYPYATLNTANFEYLMGGNWVSISKASGAAAPLLLAALAAVFGWWWIGFFRSKKYWIIETILIGIFIVFWGFCAFFGASWTLVGTGAMAFAFLIVLSMMIRCGKIRMISYLGALLFILLYVFGLKMHERYLFPALFLLIPAWIDSKDRRILYLMLLLSFPLMVNEGIVLDNSIRLGSSMGHLNPDTTWLADILSLIHCASAVYAVFLGGKLIREEKPAPVPERKAELAQTSSSPFMFRPNASLLWTRRDTILMLAITAAFSILSLTTLGSTKAPQTVWTSSSEDENIIFDLGEDAGDITAVYFGQVNRFDFSLAQSYDGENWSEESWAQMEEGQCWKWKYVTYSTENGDGSRNYFNSTKDDVIHFTGRYIRLTAHQIGLKLNEVLFRNSQGEPVVPTIVSRNNGEPDSSLYSNPENLIDEPDTLENLPGFFGIKATDYAEPSWWNSTYFDEIYHARTAYEFLKGTVPYETSHPPLGKVLMSCAVAVFGMTPFGWRFAGALAGILMLPGIYLIAKQLTKKTWAGAFACFLFAADCMHLTQSQIATIDSFPVLFIIFSFFFMLRFIQMDIVRTPLKKLLTSLGLSGFFMGLSIASKWIGIYAGLGLAVLFFFHCARQILLQKRIRLESNQRSLSDDEKKFALSWLGCKEEKNPLTNRIITICLWCLLFFILIPLCIYLLSYIPYMAYNKRISSLGDYIQAVFNAQVSMLNYHSKPGLGMDHPFYSPWWEWPVIGKPMFYATKQYVLMDSDVSYSIFCFGNPVVWFGGLAGLIVCAARALICKGKRRILSADSPRLVEKPYNESYIFLFVGFAAQFLPWVLVPRGTYIYHYFASIPFIILALVLAIHDWKGISRPVLFGVVSGISLLALISFIIFLPYACGLVAPVGWLDLGKGILRIWY